MSEAEKPVAENQTCKQGSTVVASHEATQCYFRPETEELVFITGCQAREFETHWRSMMIDMDAFHQANAHYSSVLERYGHAAAEVARSDLETEKHLSAVDAAESDLEEKRAKIKDTLGGLSHEGMSYDDVVELIPIGREVTKAKRGGKSVPYAYVKKGYFSNTRDGRKLHTVSMKNSNKRGGAESIYSRDKNGKMLIDTGKLGEQLTTLEWPRIKVELKDVLDWAGLEGLDELNKDYVLFDWAESWNNSLRDVEEKGADVDVSSGAQFMRFVSNVGASAEFDADEGQASIKGEAKSSLTLASGFVNRTLYAPDRMGWALVMKTREGQDFNLGMLRLSLESQVSGFIGASAQLEGQLQVVVAGDQQGVAGQSGGRLPRFRERRAAGLEFHQAMQAEDEGLQLSAELFAGGRLEGSVKGSVQWLKPTPPPDPGVPLPNLLKSSGEFTDFCTIGASIASLVGVGVGGKLHCTFINGKFCFHVAASLCWGAGAKGGFIAEVSTENIVEFGAWLIYQLYSLDYSFFEVMDRRTFEAYSQYCVMQMANMRENIYQGYDRLVKTPDDVADNFDKFVAGFIEESKKGMEASKGRNRLARNVIEFERDLLLYTPEAKGILLYLLTRHGKIDHIDLENRTPLLDIYRERKGAILSVLTSIQTVAEWKKVMCRMTTDGSSLMGESSNEAEVVKEQEEHLVRFLQEGHNRDKGMEEAKQDLAAVYKRLKKTVAWGYALDMNNTWFYDIHRLPDPHYPQRCLFGPCEPEPSRFV